MMICLVLPWEKMEEDQLVSSIIMGGISIS